MDMRPHGIRVFGHGSKRMRAELNVLQTAVKFAEIVSAPCDAIASFADSRKFAEIVSAPPRRIECSFSDIVAKTKSKRLQELFLSICDRYENAENQKEIANLKEELKREKCR